MNSGAAEHLSGAAGVNQLQIAIISQTHPPN
jgi:hypothetical protein